MGGGGRGGRPGEKGAGGVREAGEERTGSRILKVAGSGRKRENYATLRHISRSKKAKRREPTTTEREPGLKGTGSGRFQPPIPPPNNLCKCVSCTFLIL